MRILRVFLPLVALALLAGCGDRRMVLKVDVLSFMDPADTHASYGPVLAVPGGLWTGEVPLVSDLDVNLFDGLGSVADMEDVTLFVSIEARDSTGSGADTMRVYMSDTTDLAIKSPPVLTIPITLQPGMSDTASVTVTGDARVLQLFSERKMRVTVTTSLRGPSSGAALNGSVRMLSLDAELVTKRKKDL